MFGIQPTYLCYLPSLFFFNNNNNKVSQTPDMDSHSQQPMQAMQRHTTIYLCASGPRPMLAFLFGAPAPPLRAIASNLCRLCSATPLSTYAPVHRGLDAGSPLRNGGFLHTSTTAADCVMSSPLCFRSRQMVGGQSHHLRRRLHYVLHEVGGIGSNVATLRWS